MAQTYLFYDIETTGLNKCFDQVVQFAAIRTDQALNELERHEFYIKLKKDVIPSPHAFITHRIPLSHLENGLSEYLAMKKIHALFNTPGTITLGYNTLGFDDEFLRFSFYRNLLPPYTHQYANGCSRMDLYPMAITYHLFKHDLMAWPANDLKLENISSINNLTTGQAHNAMTDVLATVELAKRFFQDQATWHYLSGFFNKEIDYSRHQLINNDANNLAILIDGKFGLAQQYQSAAISLGSHNHFRNQTLWLRLDLPELEEITCDNFIDKTWVVNKKMGEPCFVLPMKSRFMKQYLQQKEKDIGQRKDQITSNGMLWQSIKNHYRNFTYPKIDRLDVYAKLYDAGFNSESDEQLCRQFHLANTNNKIKLLSQFNAAHLQELALRIIGHENEADSPSSVQEEFISSCESIKNGENELLDYTGKKRYTKQAALKDIDELALTNLDSEQQQRLAELQEYLTG